MVLLRWERDVDHAGRKKIEAAAGVNFHEEAEAELLIEFVQIYFDDRQILSSKRLKELLKRRRRGRPLGDDVTDIELRMHDDRPLPELTDRMMPQHVLNVVVKAVLEVWHEHSAKRATSFYSRSKQRHDGPAIRLLQELFRQAGVPESDWPGPHSLHDAIQRALGSPDA